MGIEKSQESSKQYNSDFCANATATKGIDAYSCKDVQVKYTILGGILIC